MHLLVTKQNRSHNREFLLGAKSNGSASPIWQAIALNLGQDCHPSLRTAACHLLASLLDYSAMPGGIEGLEGLFFQKRLSLRNILEGKAVVNDIRKRRENLMQGKR